MPLILYNHNVAMLPEKQFRTRMFPGIKYQLNGHFLEDNLSRAEVIIDNILKLTIEEKKAPDILAFQEVFDTDMQKYFIARLQNKYPHYTIPKSDRCCKYSSGLMVFSRFKILDEEFTPFNNEPFGEEWFANKGFLVVKIQINPSKCINIINTHLISNNKNFHLIPIIDDIAKSILDSIAKHRGGPCKRRRDQQLQKIYDHIKDLKDDSFLVGDFNISLNKIENFYPEVKHYSGRKSLFSLFSPNIPKNLCQEQKNGTYCGSFIPEESLMKAKSKQQIIENHVGNKLFDGIFKCKSGSGQLETEILQVSNASDHRAIVGYFT